MLKLLTCVQGHFWEVSQPSDNGAAPDAASFRCPVCGTPADELPLIDFAPSETALEVHDTPTPPPKPQPLLDARGEPIVAGYEILKSLGKNKKGVLLYRAKQVLINRIVVLKVVLAKDDNGQISWGALRGEANTLAKITHPNVPQIYEVGERERQLFYNAVEWFEGVPLSDKAQGKPVPPAEAAQFIEQVARALHVAHQEGVVHRNLQPATLLVEATEGKLLGKGSFKIDGFGLAGRPVEGDINDVELQGKLPHYLSPEQAWGYAKDIGPSSDVYALGVILYELLTGRLPHWGERASEIIEHIRSRAATPPREINRRVPADLDAICRKCLQKPPRKRYASALELAEDLRRYQDGLPIKARDPGTVKRLFKWASRRPAVAIILVLLFMLFVSPLVAFLIGLSQNAGDSYRYREAVQNANQAAWEAQNERQEKNKALQDERLVTYYHDILLADNAVREGRSKEVPAILNADPNLKANPNSDPLINPLVLRQWEWHYLMSKTRAEVAPYKPGVVAISSMAFNSDARWLAVAGDKPDGVGRGVVHFLNANTGISNRNVEVLGRPQDIAFSPVGSILAIVSQNGPNDLQDGNGGRLTLYNVENGLQIYQVTIGRPTSVAYSPNGKYIAVGCADGQARLFNAVEGSQVNRGAFADFGFGDPKPVRVAFSADSSRLARCDQSMVTMLGVPAGENLGSLRKFFNINVTDVAYTPGDRVITGYTDRMVRIWDSSLNVKQGLQCEANPVRIVFATEGKRVAVLLANGPDATKPPLLHWYDGTTLREILTVRDLPNQVNAIAIDKQGRRLAVASSTDVRIYGGTNP